MTETLASAAELISYELTQVGYEAGPGDRNKYSADLGRGPEAWCADFQGDCSRHVAGDPLKPYFDPYTPTFAGHFQAANRWFTDQGSIQAGDVVFFDRIGAGRISHVGLAVNSAGTVEGNTPIGTTYFGVGRHPLPDHTYRGHGRPEYGPGTTPVKVPPSAPDKVTYGAYQHVRLGARYIRLGDRGDDVMSLQSVLDLWYPHMPQLDKDGADGPLTTARVKYLQRAADLEIDGVVGPATFHVLHVATSF